MPGTTQQRSARLLHTLVDLSMDDTLSSLVPQGIPARLRECSPVALPFCQRSESTAGRTERHYILDYDSTQNG